MSIVFLLNNQDNIFSLKLESEEGQANFKVNESVLSKLKHDSRPLPEPQTGVKILCYVLLSRSKVKTAFLIKETWGSHCDDLVFFGGYAYPNLPVTYINASEGYGNLWGKAKAAMLYLTTSKYKVHFTNIKKICQSCANTS